MKLEVGKTYVDEDGHRVKISERQLVNGFAFYRGGKRIYQDDGYPVAWSLHAPLVRQAKWYDYFRDLLI